MKIQDYITIAFSSAALLLSIIGAVLQYLSYKSNSVKIKLVQNQYDVRSVPLGKSTNVLYRKNLPTSKVEIEPTFYLVVDIRIFNKSIQPISVADFFINGLLIPHGSFFKEQSKPVDVIYTIPEKENNANYNKLKNHDVGNTVSILGERATIDSKHYDKLIYPGVRIDSRGLIEGTMIFSFSGLKTFKEVFNSPTKLSVEAAGHYETIELQLRKTGYLDFSK